MHFALHLVGAAAAASPPPTVDGAMKLLDNDVTDYSAKMAALTAGIPGSRASGQVCRRIIDDTVSHTVSDGEMGNCLCTMKTVFDCVHCRVTPFQTFRRCNANIFTV